MTPLQKKLNNIRIKIHEYNERQLLKKTKKFSLYQLLSVRSRFWFGFLYGRNKRTQAKTLS